MTSVDAKLGEVLANVVDDLLGYTHHAFAAEAFELNGQLEQVINHVRQRFPKLRVD